MGRTLNEVMASLPKARRRAVEKRADELIAEELSLRDLRKALQLTQTDVAATLGKGQDEVSRIEQREDLLLSTLHGYVRSLGGELELGAADALNFGEDVVQNQRLSHGAPSG